MEASRDTLMSTQEQERMLVTRILESQKMDHVRVFHAHEETGWTIIAEYADHNGKHQRIVLLRDPGRTLRRIVEGEISRSTLIG